MYFGFRIKILKGNPCAGLLFKVVHTNMKIWHSCIMGEGGTYLLSVSDYSYEPWCDECYENTIAFFLIPSIQHLFYTGCH